jgi:polyisoprenoid-binding protein YceI
MKPLRVLLLNRSPERREELATALRQAQHEAIPAADARSAAEALTEPGFDAVLLDLTSPELDLPALRHAIFPTGAIEPDALEEVERRHLALTLRHTGGNKRRAAHLLGISRSTLLNKVRKYGLVVLASLLPLGRGALQAQVPSRLPPGRVVSGTLSFDGHATAGDFVGKTDSVSGVMTGGPSLAAVKGWVEAPVRTLKTGDGRRDKDLNKSMESGKYPNIRFELAATKPAGRRADSLPVTLHGVLMLHGVSRQVDLPAVIVFKDQQARVRSDFPVNLKDYRVGGLSKLLGMLKMSENIEVHVDLLFRLDPSS